MEYFNISLFALLGGVTGVSVFQWYLWRNRAMAAYHEMQAHKQQADRVNEMWNNLYDERLRNHNAMMEVFDCLNDNGPFASHHSQLMQCKNILLHAIQNSTFREK